MVDVSDGEIDKIYQKVLNDDDKCNWCIFTINDKNKLIVSSYGDGGMHECIKKLESDQVYCFF